MTISATELAKYRRDGFILVPDMLAKAELDEIRTELAKLIEAARSETESNDVYDLGPRHGEQQTDVRRIKAPHRVMPSVKRLIRHPRMVSIIEQLFGTGVRFQVSKLNLKSAHDGAAVEWHQDWAFYPQTNDDMLAVGVMLEDCTLENGPLMVVPGSHKGKIYDHHQKGHFVGGINAENLGDVPEHAVPLTAPAGSISIHHVRTLHGSTVNRSDKNRPLLLFNYVAVDAFPIFHSYDWDEFNSRILRGEPTFEPRLAPVPVRIHAPTPPTEDGFSTGSLFALQEGMEGALYSDQKSSATT